MKIILAEETQGGTGPETAFDGPEFIVGREPAQCSFVFDSASHPMVSRRHARFLLHDGRWFLEDLGSSFGTFLGGVRISGAVPVDTGSLVQFGEQGPQLRVVRFEPGAAQSVLEPSAVSSSDGTVGRSAASDRSRTGARIDFPDGVHPRVGLTSSTIVLGRDASCTVVFANAAMVSRRHAEISFREGTHVLTDNNSFNGTLVNGVRIARPTRLSDGDRVSLGVGGPTFVFSGGAPGSQASGPADGFSKTMVANLGSLSQELAVARDSVGELVQRTAFDGRSQLTVGRDLDSDIVLDGLQISNRHARFVSGSDGVSIEDLRSTNGVFVRGERTVRRRLGPADLVQIGNYVLTTDGRSVSVFDARSKMRIDAVELTKDVRNRSGAGDVRLLDRISLSIAPNEFVGLLGPSGAGKSTLMDALNGMRPVTSGRVRMNGTDLYENLDSFKQSIGYVPQEDIIHRELSVERTLYYVAKLRLSRDVSKAEIDRIVEEVLDVTGLSERREVPVGELSGGQRKRVSIAVELITKPSVIFLDEPTSGLDPATEDRVMRLFRRIADSGRTIVMTTHAMDNVKLFDKVVVMMRGKLVFFGTPDEALTYFGAVDFQEVFDRLEESVAQRVGSGGDLWAATEEAAEDWKRRYATTAEYHRHVSAPLKDLDGKGSSKATKKRRLGVFGGLRQFATLAKRYAGVLLKDRLNLAILFGQAPVIALMTFLVMAADLPRDFVYFILALVSVWFGTSVAAREIVREKPVYIRERMVNLGLLPYVGSKLAVLGTIVGLQCLMLWVPLKVLDVAGVMPMPGSLLGIPQLTVMLLTASVGIALGLLISALVRTSEMATSLVPLVLVPQLLFSGLVGVPSGVGEAVGLVMPASWSFDSMKRFSTLDTLEPEGSEDGRGLYGRIEDKNDAVIAEARRNVDESRAKLQRKVDVIWEALEAGEPAGLKPGIGDPPVIGAAERVPADLSAYVRFKHPLMGTFVNLLVLLLMFGMLTLGTLAILRMKDIR
jgi:ABC-type multidrug transport system ATPase subunit